MPRTSAGLIHVYNPKYQDDDATRNMTAKQANTCCARTQKNIRGSLRGLKCEHSHHAQMVHPGGTQHVVPLPALPVSICTHTE